MSRGRLHARSAGTTPDVPGHTPMALAPDRGLPSTALLDATRLAEVSVDVVIVGSGMGGSTLAWALKESGLSVLVVERGAFLPHEPENADFDEVFAKGRYRTEQPWMDTVNNRPFAPGVYSWVGGSTKMYAASTPRFREKDFTLVRHRGGVSPAWPFDYDDLEAGYRAAEVLYRVHGTAGEDPSDPPRSTPFPFPQVEHEPAVERLADALRRQGLHPTHMPCAMDLESESDRVGEATSAGGPSYGGRKGDAENRALLPALRSGSVRLVTNAEAMSIETTVDGVRATGVVVRHRLGATTLVRAGQVVVSAGAVNSAALLLRSASPAHPNGLANRSDQVGRNYMCHNATVLMAVHPWRKNRTVWQKTLSVNDFYESSPQDGYPLGHIAMMGKIKAPMLKSAAPVAPRFVLKGLSDRSIDLQVASEDLPDPENRVTLNGDEIGLAWRPTNEETHRLLVREVVRSLRRAGYPFVLRQRMGISYNSHQCGTVVAGHDPLHSVLDPDCRAHDVENLWVVDGSFFPSAAALNPALTIAANAIRVAPKIIAAAAARRP